MLCAYANTIAQNSFQFASYRTTLPGKSFFRLGDNLLTITKQGDVGLQPFVFISLHNNETTASSAALDFIEKNGGQLISLENNFQRNIEFELISKKYSLDPNQIFTKRGRSLSLHTGPYKNMVAVEIQRFAHFILQEIPDNKILVSMHNHDDQEWGLNKFAKGKWKRNAKTIYINPEQDEDDYFVTTDEYVFNTLKEKKWNVMLYNSRNARDDGSMIVYYGRLNKMYIDLVTEFGHYEQQQKMVAALAEILK
jgi:hypothetical protein